MRTPEKLREARLEVVQALAEAVTAAEAVPRVLAAFGEVLGWDAGAHYAIDEGVLVARHVWRRRDDCDAFLDVTRAARFAAGRGLPGRVWSAGRPAWIADVLNDDNFPRAGVARECGLHAAFAFPIRVGAEVIGVAEFFSREVREPDADVLEMAATVGAQVGLFLDRRRAEDELRRRGHELAEFFENATEGLHWIAEDGTILRANRAELDMLGYAPDEYVGHNVAEFHADEHVVRDMLRRLREGESLRDFEARMLARDGSIRHVLVNSSVYREDGRFVHTRCFTRDVTERVANDAVLAGQRRLLELMVHGAPLEHVLEAVCSTIEDQASEPVTPTVLLVSPDGSSLRHFAGQSCPAGFAATLREIPIGPRAGACGTAAFLKRPVVCEDIADDPLWEDHPAFRDQALADGLRGCWSTPILAADGRVLGTFALYSGFVGEPPAHEVRIVEVLARTAAIAIERHLAQEALRRTDRRKDEFLATLAHEMRNPLAPVVNALHILKARAGAQPEVAWAHDVITRQVQQLTRLVDDLLDVSRISRGKVVLHKELVDLGHVVQRAVESCRPLLEEKGQALAVELGRELTLEADAARLQQVVVNLLTNAGKYTPGGGHVRIEAQRDGDAVELAVVDDGIGMTPEFIASAFEIFSQADEGREHARGGLGIGLSLVRNLVEMHGGSVELASPGPDLGTRVTLRLPAAVPRSARPASPGGTPAASAEPTGPPRRVLIVDDDRDSAQSLGMLIRAWGHDVHTSYDGLSALEAAGSYRPDVVLLDITMPGLNGHDVARRVREQPENAAVVLVAITGWAQETDRDRSRAAGFDLHLAKPVDPLALQRLLQQPAGISS